MIRRIKAEFTRDVFLPRFSIKKGEIWEVRVDRLQVDGFSLAGGFVFNNDFKVVI
jgi:hypothetical protein